MLTLADIDENVPLDRKSIRVALRRAIDERYLEPVRLPEEQGGAAGFRLKLDLSRFTVDEREFDGFYPLPTHRIRVPLEFFNTVVNEETLATVKVVACIIRLTLGSIDNLGQPNVAPAISQLQFVRRMNMGRRQAIQGVQAALSRSYIRRFEQGSLEQGRPSTYGLYWRRADQALSWPGQSTLEVVSMQAVMGKRDQADTGKRDQADGKKGSGGWEKGIRRMGKGIRQMGKRDQAILRLSIY